MNGFLPLFRKITNVQGINKGVKVKTFMLHLKFDCVKNPYEQLVHRSERLSREARSKICQHIDSIALSPLVNGNS